MFRLKTAVFAISLSVGFSAIAPALPPLAVTAQAASKVAVVVNGVAITTGDIQRRVNFLRLQRAKGNLSTLARDQLVNEVLEREAVLKSGTSVSTEDVDAAFARFASNNKMSLDQLNGILKQAGVGADHFKAFIAISMSWPRAVAARYGGASGKLTPGEVGARIVESGKAPSVNEYILKQVIFVVPEKRRNAILGKRKAEAEASRKKFPGCDQAKEFAATMHDVSVRDLGRYMEPELPEMWKAAISKAAAGGTTPSQVTPRGVEYIAVCSKREVSDDAAAALVFNQEDSKKFGKEDDSPNAKKYLEELRAQAQIVNK